MIATLTSRCPLCSGRILKGRSRITNIGDRTVRQWAHQACADRDPDHQRSLRRKAARMRSHIERSQPPDD
jgi:DNA-directed RNA polymerase subunit RPC12/RpoP